MSFTRQIVKGQNELYVMRIKHYLAIRNKEYMPFHPIKRINLGYGILLCLQMVQSGDPDIISTFHF